MESITQVLRRKAETRLENALANGLRPRRALKDYSNQKSLYVYESTDDENSDQQEKSKRKPMPKSKRRSTRNGGRESSAQSDDSEDVPLAKKFTNSKNQTNDSSEEDVPLAKKFSGPKRKKGGRRKIKSESEEDEDDKSNISDDKDKVQESVENGHVKQNGQEATDEDVKNEVKDEPTEEKNPRLGRTFEGQSIPQEQPLLIKGGVMKGYQIEGLMWMASLRKVKANGILADEMGLGKTLQTISLFCHVAEVEKDAGPFLVIAPLSTLHNWKREVERFAPGFPVKVKLKFLFVAVNM